MMQEHLYKLKEINNTNKLNQEAQKQVWRPKIQVGAPLEQPKQQKTEQVWMNCRLDLTKRSLEKAIAVLPPQMKHTHLDCLNKQQFPFSVSGEEKSRNWYIEYLDSLLGWKFVSRRQLADQSLQNIAPTPASLAEAPAGAPALTPGQPLVVDPMQPSSPSDPYDLTMSPIGGKISSASPEIAPFLPSGKHTSNRRVVAIAVVVTAAFTFLFSGLLFYCYHKCCKNNNKFGDGQKDDRPLLTLSMSDFSIGSSASHKSMAQINSSQPEMNKEKIRSSSFYSNRSENGWGPEMQSSPSPWLNNHAVSIEISPISSGPNKSNSSLSGIEIPSPGAFSAASGFSSGPSATSIDKPAPPVPPPPPMMPSGGKTSPPPPPPIPTRSKLGPQPPPPPPPAKGVFPPRPPVPPPPRMMPSGGKTSPPPPPPIPTRSKPGPLPPPPPAAAAAAAKGAFPPRPPPSGLVPPKPSSLGLSNRGNTGSGSPSGSKVEAEAPKAKLKPFFWDKVPAKPDHSMVWDHISAGSFQFNEDMIEKLFGYSSTNTHKKESKRESSEDPPQHHQILDARKAQNLSILLRALNVTTEEVRDAILEGNELPIELLKTMLKMAPTVEEELKLRLFAGPLSQLQPAERFLKGLVEIPFAFKRMDILLFMGSLQEEVTGVKESFVTLEVACKELRNSRLFLKLLEAVLKTGNRMNDGTFRGGALAFKLDTLLKLADVKGTDNKTTLLHFVVQEIIRSEGVRAARMARESGSISSFKSDDLLEDSPCETGDHYRSLGLQVVSSLSTELENVKKAAALDADTLTGVVSGLGHGLVKSKEFLNSEMKSLEEESGFHNILSCFVENAENEITWLLGEDKRIRSLLKGTIDYFHGNAGKDEGLRLFVIVRDFLGMLDKTCKEVSETPKKFQTPRKRDAATPPLPNHRNILFPVVRDRQVDSDEDDESPSP